MKIFGQSLSIAWEYRVRAILWRVHHGVGGRIVGEERDPNEKRTYFFCLDQHTGRILWERLALEEPWWVGISFVESEIVFLHGYASPDLPIQRGVTAVDMFTGAVLWKNTGWTVEARGKEGLIVSAFDRSLVRRYEVALRTGEILREIASQQEAFSPGDQAGDAGVISPVPVSTASLDAETRHIVESRLAPAGPERMIECVDLPSCLVVDSQDLTGIQPGAAPHVRVILRVLKKPRGKELFHDVIAGNASGFIPEAFFIQGSILHYVREQSSLCAVHLPET